MLDIPYVATPAPERGWRPAVERRPRRRTALGLLEGACWAVALAAAGYLAWGGLDALLDRARRVAELIALTSARTEAAPALAASADPEIVPPPPPRPRPAPGELVGRIEIPAVGVSAFVAAGTSSRTMRRGVGHIDGTALPGEPGNVGLAGHRDTFLRGLRRLKKADRIVLVTPDGSFDYVVESLLTVDPGQVDVLDPSPYPTLTLVTCYPFDYVGAAPMRFVVRAREMGRTDAPLRRPDASLAPAVLSTEGAGPVAGSER